MFWKKTLLPLIMLVFAGIYFNEVRQLDALDQALIKPVFFFMVLLFMINTASDYRESKDRQSNASALKKGNSQFRKILEYIALTAVYLMLMPYLGFMISSILFLAGALYRLNVRKTITLIALPVGLSVLLYFLFVHLFSVPLPTGIFII